MKRKYILLALLFLPVSFLGAQQTKHLEILQTSDTHSRIEPIPTTSADRSAGMGGAARRAAFIKQERTQNPDLLVFDCGDISQGTPYYNVFRGELEVRMMNLMGYDAMLQRAEKDKRCVQWVDSVFNKMSLKERIGQLLIYTIAPQKTKKNRELLRKVVEEYKVGGLLFSGGLMLNQAMLTNEAQRMAKVPLMITFDGEWGLSMIIPKVSSADP